MSNFYLYLIFAIAAIIINLLTQNILDYFLVNIYIQIFSGTLAGLLIKYFLDKKFVFGNPKVNTAKSFMLYSFFGGMLTPLWWSIELVFVFYFGTLLAQNIGALIGLTVCYYLKYLLDKKYVFVSKD